MEWVCLGELVESDPCSRSVGGGCLGIRCPSSSSMLKANGHASSYTIRASWAVRENEKWRLAYLFCCPRTPRKTAVIVKPWGNQEIAHVFQWHYRLRTAVQLSSVGKPASIDKAPCMSVEQISQYSITLSLLVPWIWLSPAKQLCIGRLTVSTTPVCFLIDLKDLSINAISYTFATGLGVPCEIGARKK